MISQSKDFRKVSSGMKKPHRKKRLYERGSRATLTKIGVTATKTMRARAKIIKLRLIRTNVANVFDPNSKTFKKVTIKTVLQNQSNRHFARANIMTHGAVIDTDIGKAKITNRPGQEGVINATLI